MPLVSLINFSLSEMCHALNELAQYHIKSSTHFFLKWTIIKICTQIILSISYGKENFTYAHLNQHKKQCLKYFILSNLRWNFYDQCDIGWKHKPPPLLLWAWEVVHAVVEQMLETEAGSEEVTWRAWPPDREKYTIYAWYVIESAFLKKQLKFSHMDFWLFRTRKRCF